MNLGNIQIEAKMITNKEFPGAKKEMENNPKLIFQYILILQKKTKEKIVTKKRMI